MYRRILITIALCFAVVMTFGQTSAQTEAFNQAEFATFIEDVISASSTPGLAVIVFAEEASLYEGSFGIAGPDNCPVTLDTPFPIGSISKSFAALALLQLADEGQLDLDAAVVNYLPEFQTRDPKRSKEITVRQLLSHRSGFSTIDGNRIHDDENRNTDALDYALAHLSKTTLKYTPGEAFEYSNANYMIAAALVERMTERSYETVIDERIFKPLGMTNSYVHMPLRSTARPATGYRQWFGKPIAYSGPSSRIWVAAGGVTSSANDVMLYLRAVASKDPRVVPTSNADQLTASQVEDSNPQFDYALGWMLHKHEGRTIVFHSGLVSGFAAQAAFFADDKSGVVVLTNQSGALSADVPGVVVSQALGVPTGPTHPSKGQKFLVWGMALTTLIIAFSAIFSTHRFNSYTKSVEHVPVYRRVVPAVALFGLAFGVALIAPQANGMTLSGMRVFFPDIWLCLLLSALILFLWGLTRLFFSAMLDKEFSRHSRGTRRQ